MATILLLLDAFRHDYLSELGTPFLWRCMQEGEHYRCVEQSLGFCERTEILTGQSGERTGFLCAIGFDPSVSPYRDVPLLWGLHLAEKGALSLLCLLPPRLAARIHGRLRHMVSLRFRKRGISMPPYLIPFGWLPYFALTEDRLDHREPAAFATPSILELLARGGKSYCYETFSALGMSSPYRSDASRLEGVLHDLKGCPKDLYLVYQALPDSAGHSHGPESLELRGELQRLDADLERFVRGAEAAAPGNRYLFLGDHGMMTVRKKVDAEDEILRLLRTAGLKPGRDVIYFLDSTMVRLWAFTGRARTLLPGLLSSSELFGANGSWMDDDLARSCRAPWPDRRYGDHLWLAHPGVLVFPDFFHRLAPCRGMHGYDPAHPDSRGTCIVWGAGTAREQHPLLPLAGIFDLLRRNLDV